MMVPMSAVTCIGRFWIILSGLAVSNLDLVWLRSTMILLPEKFVHRLWNMLKYVRATVCCSMSNF